MDITEFSLGKALGGHLYRGILCIRNLLTDTCWLSTSHDLGKDIQANRFHLDLGIHPCRSLQEDYAATGLEPFIIEPVALLDEDVPVESLENQLAALLSTTRTSMGNQHFRFYI